MEEAEQPMPPPHRHLTAAALSAPPPALLPGCVWAQGLNPLYADLESNPMSIAW
jgi:hypothetical protein